MDPTWLDATWISARSPIWILVLARIGGVCMTAPMAAAPGVDRRLRIVLALGLGLVLLPVLEPMVSVPPVGPAIAWMAALELLVGALLGWAAGLIVAGARQAGDLVAAQAGLSASVFLDPEAGAELTPLGHLYGLVALGVFLSLNGPLVLVGALVESYRTIPAGSLMVDDGTVTRTFTQLGGALLLTLQAAAPVAIALALAGLVLGWIGRLAPGIPLLALSLPARAILGIVLVFLGLATLVSTLSRSWTVWLAAP
jgi:flagellar biosynthesis protein FliR